MMLFSVPSEDRFAAVHRNNDLPAIRMTPLLMTATLA
jgi:hypothetical protein